MNKKGINILLLCVSFTFLLSACSNELIEEQTNIDKTVVKNQTSSQIENEDFKLILKSEKTVYRKGESLNIQAEITYLGEHKSIEILHGNSPIIFSTTNVTNNYQFGSSSFVPKSTTILERKNPYVELYEFSGGIYIPQLEGEPYTEEEYQKMTTGYFPVGQYEITSTTDFSLEGDLKTKHNAEKLQTSLIITIEN